MSGAKVWQNYCDGKLDAIRHYCETDVLNTYLVYLRFLLIQGKLAKEEYDTELELVLETLRTSEQAHLQEFANHCKNP